jgi:hypothetical protein
MVEVVDRGTGVDQCVSCREGRDSGLRVLHCVAEDECVVLAGVGCFVKVVYSHSSHSRQASVGSMTLYASGGLLDRSVLDGLNGDSYPFHGRSGNWEG